MVKRRLSEQQQRRIRKNRQQSADASDTNTASHQGRVIARYGKNADVEALPDDSLSSSRIIRCHIRANLNALSPRSMADYQYAENVVTGDIVDFSLTGDADSKADKGLISQINDRSSLMLRPDSRGRVRPVAANIQSICIVLSPLPEPHENLIDRYLVAAEVQGIKPLLICNKTDLLSAPQLIKFKQRFAVYAELGYQLFYVSAHQPETLLSLEQYLSERTAIFVGQSGVGKSSLLDALIPGFSEQIGDLSTAKSGKTKGKHTTTTSRLYHLPKGGEVIDSPGIREFGLWHLSREDISRGFIEIADHAQHCRFRDCKHQSEPSCAVLAAVETGAINSNRFGSYRFIQDSLNDVSTDN